MVKLCDSYAKHLALSNEMPTEKRFYSTILEDYRKALVEAYPVKLRADAKLIGGHMSQMEQNSRRCSKNGKLRTPLIESGYGWTRKECTQSCYRSRLEALDKADPEVSAYERRIPPGSD
jgi:hypothetical protein